MNFVSLFAGIGGLDLGLERAGFRCVAQVEIAHYARATLTHRWPNVPKWSDVRTFTKGCLDGVSVDLIAGGFPCQDISHAGRRAGIKAERSGLYAEVIRLAREIRPRYVLLENVAALLVPDNSGDAPIATVLGDLAELGFDAEWRVLDARYFGVPQRRRRVFILAYPAGTHRAAILHQDAVDVAGYHPRLDAASDRPTLPDDQAGGACAVSVCTDAVGAALRDDWRGRVDGRLSDWMAAYKGIGNSVVPQVAEWIGRCILAANGGAA